MRQVVLIMAAIAISLMTFPMLAYHESGIYHLSLALPKSYHFVVMFVYALIIIGVILLVVGKAKLPRTPPLPVAGAAQKYLLSTAWIFWIGFVMSYVTIIPAAVAFRSGDFLAARDQVAFGGVGIFYRLYMISLPVLMTYERRRVIRLIVVFTTISLTAFRSYIFSERSTIFELVSVMGVCYMFRVIRPNRSVLLLFAGLGLSLFLATFSARMLSQSRRGAHDTLHQMAGGNEGFATGATTIIYYTDTQNKAYAILLGLLPPYDGKRFAQIAAVISDRKTQSIAGDKYANANAHTGLTDSALTNPGGLAEDISDFGVLGLLVSILKFGAAALVFTRSKTNRVALVILPFFVEWMLEYARFNYYYLPYVAALMMLATIWMGCSFLFSERQVHRRGPRWNRGIGTYPADQASGRTNRC